ncbi:MAG: phospholipase effector Tle1 domain-containing protein [Methyloceanibacter sp.]|uniref:phospholipase effector Tle1 domain-containing protein n=1 Tax=Methyloceanibacter sp. TaxID=1965321 RepID=UPI003D6CE640
MTADASSPAPHTPPEKRLAVFLDGTWNTVNHNTNVWRLRALCAKHSADGSVQRAYYDPDVGTLLGQKVRGGWWGIGINENIVDAYQWLIENYDPGDEIFIFGFSRGAYTARSLSGLISKCLLRPGAPLSLDQLYGRYRRASEPRTIRTLLKEQASNPRFTCTLEEAWLTK